VEGLAVGNNVVVEPYFVDGDCDMCGAGSYHLCRQMGFIGLSGGGGGLSEKIVVDKRWVHPDGDIPLDEAALIKPLSVAHARWRAAAPKPATSRWWAGVTDAPAEQP
jgi:(R,R)-butanediol dehydrogenase/meso-butanediol dehydrogenase/diacetyl reductase